MDLPILNLLTKARTCWHSLILIEYRPHVNTKSRYWHVRSEHLFQIDVTEIFLNFFASTVIFLSFRRDRSGQTVQTQIRGAVWSGSTMFAIPSGSITLRKIHLIQLLGWLQQIFRVSEFLGILRNVYDSMSPIILLEHMVMNCTLNEHLSSFWVCLLLTAQTTIFISWWSYLTFSGI